MTRIRGQRESMLQSSARELHCTCDDPSRLLRNCISVQLISTCCPNIGRIPFDLTNILAGALKKFWCLIVQVSAAVLPSIRNNKKKTLDNGASIMAGTMMRSQCEQSTRDAAATEA
jgi:hypothetical protein